MEKNTQLQIQSKPPFYVNWFKKKHTSFNVIILIINIRHFSILQFNKSWLIQNTYWKPSNVEHQTI